MRFWCEQEEGAYAPARQSVLAASIALRARKDIVDALTQYVRVLNTNRETAKLKELFAELLGTPGVYARRAARPRTCLSRGSLTVVVVRDGQAVDAAAAERDVDRCRVGSDARIAAKALPPQQAPGRKYVTSSRGDDWSGAHTDCSRACRAVAQADTGHIVGSFRSQLHEIWQQEGGRL